MKWTDEVGSISRKRTKMYRTLRQEGVWVSPGVKGTICRSMVLRGMCRGMSQEASDTGRGVRKA